jgi:protein SCO1/2
MRYATNPDRRAGWRTFGVISGLLFALAAGGVSSPAQDAAGGRAESPTPAAAEQRVGLDPKLGAMLPLDVAFTDSTGREVTLRELIDRPVILSPVYIRCPSICNPLMREVARMVDLLPMKLGEEYKVLTLSFDPREHEPESAKLVRNAKAALLQDIKSEVPEGSYVFLTGTEENIRKVTDTLGFYFTQDEAGNYSHPPATVFVARNGKVVRYLEDLVLLPDNVELALIDAMEGRERSTMRKLQKMCFSYDPEAKTYVLQVNRIILAGTVVILAIFLAFLVIRRRPGRKPAETDS